MRLSKETQYAFLILMYLKRAGKANLADASNVLALSPSLTNKVAKKLKDANIVGVDKRKPGGYFIQGIPTVLQLIKLFESPLFLDESLHFMYSKGEFEERALVKYVLDLQQSIKPMLSKTFDQLFVEYAEVETRQFKNLENTLEN